MKDFGYAGMQSHYSFVPEVTYTQNFASCMRILDACLYWALGRGK
jgi:hypothetical protein